MALQAVAFSEAAASTPPTVLPNWESRVYQYEYTAAADLGFSVGSVKASGNYRLLVMDTVRSGAVTDGRRKRLWGYGYRLLIEISDVSLAGKLTLPAIAAAMEITEMEASVKLEVKGYTGDDLWGVIPAPRPFDVDTYKTYLTTTENIQKAFGEHPDKAVPVLLAEGDVNDIDLLLGGIDGPDLEASVLLVWSLRQISAGRTLAAAAEALNESDPPLPDAAQALLLGAYRELVGDDPTAAPDDAAKARATGLVGALR